MASRKHVLPLSVPGLRALRWSVTHRIRTVVYGFIIFVMSVGGMLLLPSTFMPDSDMSLAVMNIEFPPGVPLARTDAASAAAYAIVSKHPEVRSVFESVGEDANGELYITDIGSGSVYKIVP